MIIYLPVIQTVVVFLLPGLPPDPVDSVDLGVPWLLQFLLTWLARRGGCRLGEEDFLRPPRLASKTPLTPDGGWR